jgi:hypothetical protein
MSNVVSIQDAFTKRDMKKYGFVPLSATSESPMREKPNPSNVTQEEIHEFWKLLRSCNEWFRRVLK